MNLVRHSYGRRVYYDTATHTYVKHFPGEKKLSTLLKYAIRFRRSPGKNFLHISNKLKSLHIETLDVVKASDFLVVTAERHEPTLEEFLAECNNDIKQEINAKFLDFVVTVLNAGITLIDYDHTNFLYDGTNIIAIDLDNYRDDPFYSRPKNKVLNYIEHYNGKAFRNEVARRWTKSTVSQRIIDFFYGWRGKYATYHIVR
ncbi:MAG: hypothetical protein MI749_04330 [Desulfovibrionales bacterium]|nr:hypothetical protein [Desulfovibrionales bacterium]